MMVANFVLDAAKPDTAMDATARDALMQRFNAAKSRRSQWESLWQDAYDYALPQRQGFGGGIRPGDTRMDRLYDATALDCVEQLAASLLGNLTPPWTQWFGLKPGPDLSASDAERLAPALEKAARTIQAHLDRSNFIVEIHQCFLDLIVGGTACLFVEESPPGSFSAFRFTAVPLHQLVLEEGADGYLNGLYREVNMTLAQLRERYPLADLPADVIRSGERDAQARFPVLESILPDGRGGYALQATLQSAGSNATVLKQSRMADTPMIAFRWLKSPGEIYGRSPVMKSLPDIKTANKVVELILKNATIAVTGIWQADDDGVLNPANIELKPGVIIPKAVGSQGLKPLEMPGRFDISQLVLDDLRARIRHALLTDRLGQISDRRMTATEVLERSGEMALLLGATYGRLQTELMTPLIMRAFAILRRRGEVPDIAIDGRLVTLDYRSPLARAQGQRNVQNTLSWLQAVQAMGPEALAAVNLPQAARFLGDALGVPSDLILNDVQPASQAQPTLDMEILNDELLANDEASARAAASVF
ncbi:portal protein [Micavibrio aeruginosavorus]|uniref:Head-to-tail joining protein n=1 Tax=Micavibrio aeruginosavorus (strain ARL-13) TaxID=856793 RepID=G2KT11_MICAA|nr:portal protein [Micavibrio aeruginosavorus]AEP10156.1 head-to-tail joining protein [Micavibrio aeruginosavorus ARL-13]